MLSIKGSFKDFQEKKISLEIAAERVITAVGEC
jgi:hypothetical protein